MSEESTNKSIDKFDEEYKKDMAHYRMTLNFLGGNCPIEALCLPKPIQTVLLKEGYSRIYDLIGVNLGKIKGLGRVRVEVLAARLDEFLTVSL